MAYPGNSWRNILGDNVIGKPKPKLPEIMMINLKVILVFVMIILILPIVYAATDFEANMKACWNQDGDATDDSSGGLWDGATAGSITNTATYGFLGAGSGAFHYKGGDSSIAIGGVDKNFNMFGDSSVLFCMNTTNFLGAGEVFASEVSGNRGQTFHLDTTVGQLRATNGGADNYVSTTSIADGDIHCIVSTYDVDTTTERLYINGLLNVTDSSFTNPDVTVQTYFGRRAFVGAEAFYTGWIGISAFWENKTLSDAEVLELFNNLVAGGICPTLSVAIPPDLFNVTAQDLFDNEALSNFSVTFTNSTTSFHNHTGTGQLIYSDLNGIYDINISSNQSGGYFERLFVGINTTSDTSFLGKLVQSIATVRALDGFDNSTITFFTASINITGPISTSNGSVTFAIKKGLYQLNVSSGSFDTVVTNFSIEALGNVTINVTLGSIFRFNLIRESTGGVFDWNSTNKTEINIFCPNQTITLIINNTDKANANISKLINCRFTLMQIVVDYGVLGSYFRTLIPSFRQKNITFYLIDVTRGDVAVQKVLKLLDLTGDFGGAILRAKSTVSGTLKTIIEQRFDISDEVNLFLVKDRLYTINIENADQDIGLGNLIPTEAGEQSITLPRLDFAKDEAILGGNITFGYVFNITSGILRVQYNDSTQKNNFSKVHNYKHILGCIIFRRIK